MKLTLKNIWRVIIVVVFFVFMYNSKRNYYRNDLNFFNTSLSNVVIKMKQTRGTKVYYNESDFFYLSQLKNGVISVGDSLVKRPKGLTLVVYEKKENLGYSYKADVEVLKPKSNYFNYFFDFD